jgi:hypothetical protein
MKGSDVRAVGRKPALRRAVVAAIILGALGAGVAVAAAAEGGGSAGSVGSSAGSEAVFIAELGVLLLVGRLMGEAAQRIGQPAVMGQLIGGLLLGPSVLGLIWPAAQHALFPTTPCRSLAS